MIKVFRLESVVHIVHIFQQFNKLNVNDVHM